MGGMICGTQKTRQGTLTVTISTTEASQNALPPSVQLRSERFWLNRPWLDGVRPPHPNICYTWGKVSAHEVRFTQEGPPKFQHASFGYDQVDGRSFPGCVPYAEEFRFAPCAREGRVSFHQPLGQRSRLAAAKPRFGSQNRPI